MKFLVSRLFFVLLSGCFAFSCGLVFAQTALEDDLTNMNPEQRRAYLEQYLRELSPINDFLKSPDVISTSKGLECSDSNGFVPVSPWVRLKENNSPQGGEELVSSSEVAVTASYGVLVKEAGMYFLEQRCAPNDKSVIRYAKASLSAGRWNVTFMEGSQVQGGILVPTSRGFLLDQKGAVMEFNLGGAARLIRLPTKYRLAELQHSDVVASRVVLLLSTELLNPKPNKLSLMGMFNALGKTFKDEKEIVQPPAILYHLDNGKVWSVDLKSPELVDALSAFCDQTSWTKSLSCGVVSDRQWLLSPDGLQQMSSYYWRLGWVKSRAGFDMWSFNSNSSEVVVSRSNGLAGRRQVLPKKIQRVWWRNDSDRSILMFDSSH